jgi:hypothetical protein
MILLILLSGLRRRMRRTKFLLYGIADREGEFMFKHNSSKPGEVDYDAVKSARNGIVGSVTTHGKREGVVEITEEQARTSTQIRLDFPDSNLYIVPIDGKPKYVRTSINRVSL